MGGAHTIRAVATLVEEAGLWIILFASLQRLRMAARSQVPGLPASLRASRSTLHALPNMARLHTCLATKAFSNVTTFGKYLHVFAGTSCAWRLCDPQKSQQMEDTR